jgi:class 3 adenylate cyclase/tetratricopeptide (TPR) repeat protein
VDESAPVRDARKRVTLIKCDIENSVGQADGMDLEVDDQRVSRYRDAIRQVVKRYDGAIGPFDGDAVLVAFGMLGQYEDHAVRAVQAAVALRAALTQVNRELAGRQPPIKVRIGIHTGEVVVGPELGPGDLAGPTPHVAQRLQEAAKHIAGEKDPTLLSQATFELVQSAVEVERVGPLKLRGRSEPVEAFRLLRVDREAMRLPYVTGIPMVGRSEELQLFGQVYQRTATRRLCHLVTVLGRAGIGKTRLVQEFLADVGDAATVMAGHCLPYGDSSTYWPLVSMVKRVADIAGADPPVVALEKLRSLVDGQDGAAGITTWVGQMLGVAPGAGTPAEIAWALRRLFEILARVRPLIVVVDDLHRSEPTLCDTLESIADEIRNAPVLLVCVAREELVEQRPTWSGGQLNAVSMRLSPLSKAEEAEHIRQVLDAKELELAVARRVDDLTERIAEKSGGIPLYAEQYLASLEDRLDPEDDQQRVLAHLDELPAKIDDLLADRLFRLDPRDRAMIQRAAVVGKQFHVADMVALAPDLERAEIEHALATLVRRELIQHDPDPVPFLPREVGGAPFRFCHPLIRESAYKGTAKTVRAELHERFASWVEVAATGERMAEFDELIGIHLAEAYQNRLELGSDTEEYRQLAERAGERLTIAGSRAANRGNIRISLKLLDRAVALLPDDHQTRPWAALDLADALREVGEFERAVGIYQEVAEAARAAEQQAVVVHARLGQLDLMAFRDPERILGGSGEIQEAILLFAKLKDDRGLAKARRLQAYVNFAVGRAKSAEQEARRAIKIANAKNLQHLEAKARRLLCIILLWGPAPIDQVVRYSEETLEWARARSIASLEAGALTVLGRAAAMRGEFELARRHIKQAREISSELGEVLTAAADSMADGLVELLAGEPAMAEEVLRSGYETLEQTRGTGPLANVAAMLARALIVQGKNEEADTPTRICEEIAAPSELDSQVRWRALRAILLARSGQLKEAETLAREAVTRSEDSEQPDTQAEALTDLAEVLRLSKKESAAANAIDRAIALYERKGNKVAAAKLRTPERKGDEVQEVAVADPSE